MAGFLSDTETTELKNQLEKHFVTFSDNSTLIIHKEPLKIVTNLTSNSLYGYGSESNETNVSYQYNSGSFPVMALYNQDQQYENLAEIKKIAQSAGEVKVKMREDAFNYIMSGSNQLFQLDGISFNKISDQSIQNFFGLKFFYLTLGRTN